MRIEKFEDLEAWKEARKLTKDIYNVTKETPFCRDFGLKDQIRRASSSIMLNIAEGFDSGSDQQFVQFLVYSKRSCSEVQSILYIALDNQYINTEKFNSFYNQATLCRKLCFGLIKYLNKTRDSRPRTRDI